MAKQKPLNVKNRLRQLIAARVAAGEKSAARIKVPA